MTLRTLVRRNYCRKLPGSIKCHNLHIFNEWVILLCQYIPETRRLLHLHSSGLFAVPLKEHLKKS